MEATVFLSQQECPSLRASGFWVRGMERFRAGLRVVAGLDKISKWFL